MHLVDMSSLSPTARVILGLLAWRPRTGYEIKQVTDQSTRFFWGASYGQIYPELRRLEAAGLVESREEPRGRVPRRVFSLTQAGRKALDAWLEEPEEAYEVRDEGLLKLFFGDLMSPEAAARTGAPQAGVVRGVGGTLPTDRNDELGDLDESSETVLRYGIELMEWDAGWWRQLQRRLS